MLYLETPTKVAGVAYLAKNKLGGLKVVVLVNYTAGSCKSYAKILYFFNIFYALYYVAKYFYSFQFIVL